MLNGLIEKITGQRTYFSMAAFLVYPLTVGAFLWTSSSFDLLCALFALKAFTAAASGSQAKQLVRAGIFLILAVHCKEMGYGAALALPFIALAAMKTRSEPAHKSRRWFALSFGVIAACLAVRFAVLGGVGGPGAAGGAPEILSPSLSKIFFNLLVRFPIMLLFPVNQMTLSLGLFAWILAGGAAVLAAVIGVMIHRSRRNPTALYIGAAMICTMLPISFFFASGPALEGAYMLYLPAALFWLFLGVAIDSKARRFLVVFAVALFTPLAFHNAAPFSRAARSADKFEEALKHIQITPETKRLLLIENKAPYEGIEIFYDRFEQYLPPGKDSGEILAETVNDKWLGRTGGVAFEDPSMRILYWNQKPRSLRDVTDIVRRKAFRLHSICAGSPSATELHPRRPATLAAGSKRKGDAIEFGLTSPSVPMGPTDRLKCANEISVRFHRSGRALSASSFRLIFEKGDASVDFEFPILPDGADVGLVFKPSRDPRWVLLSPFGKASLALPTAGGRIAVPQV